MWRISSAPWVEVRVRHDMMASAVEKIQAYRSNVGHRVRFVCTEGFRSCELHLLTIMVSSYAKSVLLCQRSQGHKLGTDSPEQDTS